LFWSFKLGFSQVPAAMILTCIDFKLNLVCIDDECAQ
jgi:hypothetical protein